MRVTATFEMVDKLVPHLEEKLKAIPSGCPCKLLEITHGEQVHQPGREPVEADGGRGRLEHGEGDKPIVLDAGKDGELAGGSGKDGTEPGWRNSDKRVRGAVRSEKGRPLK